MSIHVDSEIGRLRRVMILAPGREIEWMVPGMMEELLFDDILYGEDARAEHASFQRLLEAAGVETLDARDLLAEVLADDGARESLFRDLSRSFGVRRRVLDRLAELPPAELAVALIGGVRADPAAPGKPSFFDLPPVPNYFFQRDPQVVLGDRVMVCSMATDAREREPLLSRLLFQHHSRLAGYAELFEIERPHLHPERRYPKGAGPTLEGGDVLVASPDTLLVGVSERTNRRGVERLAEHMRREETQFANLFLVELPSRRSYMHLDTVFTFVDRGTCLAYMPVIDGGGAEAASVYQVDLNARRLTFTLRSSLTRALADVGLDLEVIPCGGPQDLIDQQREQWTDGANAFAVAPGVIFLYRRNHRTTEELARRGWRVVDEEDVLAGGAALVGEGPTVVTILCNELSRARGGPRCMTMPLERDRL